MKGDSAGQRSNYNQHQSDPFHEIIMSFVIYCVFAENADLLRFRRQIMKSRSIHQTRKRATIAARKWPIHWPGVFGLPKRNIRQW
jgi:hypothetical protein